MADMDPPPDAAFQRESFAKAMELADKEVVTARARWIPPE
jgi:hypothetical protein